MTDSEKPVEFWHDPIYSKPRPQNGHTGPACPSQEIRVTHRLDPSRRRVFANHERSDFGVLVRGKYIERLQTNSNVVVLDPEIADLFPNASAVNAALRSLAEIARRAGSRRSRSH